MTPRGWPTPAPSLLGLVAVPVVVVLTLAVLPAVAAVTLASMCPGSTSDCTVVTPVTLGAVTNVSSLVVQLGGALVCSLTGGCTINATAHIVVRAGGNITAVAVAPVTLIAGGNVTLQADAVISLPGTLQALTIFAGARFVAETGASVTAGNITIVADGGGGIRALWWAVACLPAGLGTA